MEKQKLLEGYNSWLKALNYEALNNKSGIRKVDNFFIFLQEENVQTLDGINQDIIQRYFDSLGRRISRITGEVLSNNTIMTYRRELKRFSRYLLETNRSSFEIKVNIPKTDYFTNQKSVFTVKEIQKLYKACKDDIFGIRDKAILSVYYGCGLRRNEGANIEIRDVQFDKGILHVRKGKNYKERFVPMTPKVTSDLMEYSLLSRPKLSNENSGNMFFVSYSGRPLGPISMGNRFKQIKQMAKIDKQASLHTLRHSIATHLLEKGMQLEQIAKFLGHNCIESTQIYTHILNN